MNSADSVALVALITALIALLIALLQLLQASFGTAEGARRCRKSVIGPWAKLTRWTWSWSEFRFEVLFTTPHITRVIIAPVSPGRLARLDRPRKVGASPSDKIDLPSRSTFILYQDQLPSDIETSLLLANTPDWQKVATDPSIKTVRRFKHFFTRNKTAARASDYDVSSFRPVASWVELIVAAYRMQSDLYNLRTFRTPETGEDLLTPAEAFGYVASGHGMPKDGFRPVPGMTALSVSLRQHTWDSMPPEVTCPLASSTLGDILVIAQRMGMRFYDLDVIRSCVRAEGNGYSLSSTAVRGLGLVVQLTKSSNAPIEERALIATPYVDMLLCGTLPMCLGAGDEITTSISYIGADRTVQEGTSSIQNVLGMFGAIESAASSVLGSYPFITDLLSYTAPFMPLQDHLAIEAIIPVNSAKGLELSSSGGPSLQKKSYVSPFHLNFMTAQLLMQLKENIESTFPDLLRNSPELGPEGADLIGVCNTLLGLRSVGSQVMHHPGPYTTSSVLTQLTAGGPRDQVGKTLETLRKIHSDTNMVLNTRSDLLLFVCLARLRVNVDFYTNGLPPLPPQQSYPKFLTEKYLEADTEAVKLVHDLTTSRNEVIQMSLWWFHIRAIAWRMSVILKPSEPGTLVPASLYNSKLPVWIT